MNREKHSILDELRTDCFFSAVMEEKEVLPGSAFPIIKNKIGHLRADHDGCRWWNTARPTHPELHTKEICAEIDAVYEDLTGKDALRDMDALKHFCEKHPEACVSPEYGDEYNFYYEGQHCVFWIRLITRPKDYNLYLNAFLKGN